MFALLLSRRSRLQGWPFRLHGWVFRLRWWLPLLVLALLVVAHAEWLPALAARVPPLRPHAAAIEQLAPLALRSLYILIPLTLLAALWPSRTRDRRERGATARLSLEELQDRVAETFRAHGYAVHVRSLEVDGADLLLMRGRERMLVQCRHWHRRAVDTDMLRLLCGLVSREKAGGALLLTRGRLSVEAMRFLREAPIVLMEERALEELLQAAPECLERASASLARRAIAPTAV
ncbi:MAG: restriction endonuclease [Burkholderiales bacterium]|nr:restriction endonuclease [Burkholderiales bacterium]